MPELEARYRAQISSDPVSWETFRSRLEANFSELFKVYFHLYSGRYDFFYHLDDLLDTLARMWFSRPDDLKELDFKREGEPLWFQSQSMVGGVCYVDLFAGDLLGIKEKIPYYKELGLTYLHLMPLYKAPPGENDGGYAVSSYRELNPEIGSMDQLVDLTSELRDEGISLVLDFIFNHTSDEHEWAKKALEGENDFQDYYWFFPDRKLPDAYESNLREIFPDEKKGGVRSSSFTHKPEIDRWVWTTFHSYQWDLNYGNPEVFNRMVEEMLFLANVGVEVLRLDAVAFIWKQLGTDCENLPEAHMLIQAFNAAARISAPALLFKSEAIVHPDEVVKYISANECQLSYNPLVMALLWNSLATRKTKLLRQALLERFEIGPDCAWINYVRSHDDIGWTFSDEDASRLGINARDHRIFLNHFFSGQFEGSFARGLLFQENPITGDARISGTCASLAGLEQAIIEGSEVEIDLAMKRILLIHGIIFTIGGIPLIYFGDEIGTLNDYSFMENKSKSGDNRWVHRAAADWSSFDQRNNPNSIEWRIFQGFKNLLNLRTHNEIFSGNTLEVLNTGNDHVLGYVRIRGNQRVIVLSNFSDDEQVITANFLRMHGLSYEFTNLLTGEDIPFGELTLFPYDFLCITPR
jgi:glycosidase